MKLKKYITKTSALLLGTIILCGTPYITANAYDTYVKDINASNLNVRQSPSVSSKVIIQLPRGKDVVSGGNFQTNSQNGVRREWGSFAYPDPKRGGYSNSIRGYMCMDDSSDSSTSSRYIVQAKGATSSKSNYLYHNASLTQKARSLNSGEKLWSAGNRNALQHDSGNLNAWKISDPKNNGYTLYMNGWWANAFK